MQEMTVRWHTSGKNTSISCMRVGRYYLVAKLDRTTGVVTRLGEAFGAADAYRLYCAELARIVGDALEREEPRPEKAENLFVLQEGRPHVLNMKNETVRALMENYRDGHRIPHGNPLSEEQMKDFQHMVIRFAMPDMPEEILQKMK